MTGSTRSPGSFRFLATGSPSTDTYVVRGPRGSRAQFDGFRDGEFLFAVPTIDWGDDEAARESERTYHLRLAMGQVMASCGSPIAWLFQNADDADELRADLEGVVASMRRDFADATIDVRVPEVTGVVGTTTASGRRVVMASDLLAVAAESTSADLSATMLLPLGRPLGYADAARERFGVEVGGETFAITAHAATLWLALRAGGAELGRPLGTLDLERIDWPHEPTREEALAELRKARLVQEGWAEICPLDVNLLSLRLLPLQSFAEDPASPTGYVAVTRGSTPDARVTTPVSQTARGVIATGHDAYNVMDGAYAAMVARLIPIADTRPALVTLAQELPTLLATDVAYLEARLPTIDTEPMPVSMPPAPASCDLGLLAVGSVVNQVDDLPLLLYVGGHTAPLDPDEAMLWRIVRDLQAPIGSGESQRAELLAATRDLGVRNAEVVLDRLVRRRLVHPLRGSSSLALLEGLRMLPLLTGLSTVEEQRNCAAPSRMRVLGISNHVTGSTTRVTALEVVGTALWGTSPRAAPTLAHLIKPLLPGDADVGAAAFVLEHVRRLVLEGAAYLDTTSPFDDDPERDGEVRS